MQLAIYQRKQFSKDLRDFNVERHWEYCASKGVSNPSVFKERGAKGDTVFDRKELSRLISAIRQGAYDGVVINRISEIATCPNRVINTISEWEAHGCGIVSLEEGVDTVSGSNALLQSLAALEEIRHSRVVPLGVGGVTYEELMHYRSRGWTLDSIADKVNQPKAALEQFFKAARIGI